MEKFGETLNTNRKGLVTNVKKRIQCFIDNSSLQALGHVISLTRTPFVKRLFWFVTFSACCYGSASVLRGALSLYSQDAVSYSVETDYLEWDTAFPAVTICEVANDTRLKQAMIKNKYPSSLVSFAKEIAFWNKRFCKTCVTCKMNYSCVDDYQPIVNVVRSPCDELMGVCSFAGEDFPCCERFKPIETEYGVCFAFNSDLTGDGDVKVNRKVGLPSLIFTILRKITIRVHPSEERISVASEQILGDCYTLNRGADFEVNVVAEEIISDTSVQTISPESRDCLFKDERPPSSEGWPFEEYSYSGCVWYCRTKAHVNMCNCTYHFMPKFDKVPVCNIEGLKCLSINKESLEIDNKCHCPMSCAEVTYKAVYLACPYGGSEVIKGTVRVGQFPHLRVRRHVIRDMLGLVVDFGGVIGVFFGASILTFIEIIYIFFIRKYH